MSGILEPGKDSPGNPWSEVVLRATTAAVPPIKFYYFTIPMFYIHSMYVSEVVPINTFYICSMMTPIGEVAVDSSKQSGWFLPALWKHYVLIQVSTLPVHLMMLIHYTILCMSLITIFYSNYNIHFIHIAISRKHNHVYFHLIPYTLVLHFYKVVTKTP